MKRIEISEELIRKTMQQALWIAHDPQTARFRTKELIAYIGKAYADGELELPGEVGRFVALYDGSNDIDLGRWLGSFPYDIKLIALPAVRKEKEQ